MSKALKWHQWYVKTQSFYMYFKLFFRRIQRAINLFPTPLIPRVIPGLIFKDPFPPYKGPIIRGLPTQLLVELGSQTLHVNMFSVDV